MKKSANYLIKFSKEANLKIGNTHLFNCLLCILFLSVSFSCFSQITRTQIINNAVPYTTFTWTATSSNIWNGVSCSGKTVQTPSWVKIGSNTGMPYCWGGWTSTSSIQGYLNSGKSAGDSNTATSFGVEPSCAVGLDCSGLVSRAWALSSKYSTSTLPNISTSVALTQTQPGDILNLAGSHTRLIETNYGNGYYRVIESSATDWKTSYHTYVTVNLSSYTPRVYNNVNGGVISIPSNDDCSNAITLTPSSSCSNTFGDIAGATQSYTARGCASGLIQDVWYKFTATANGTYTIRLSPSSSMDGVVEVRQGSCSGTVLGCADSGGGNGGVENLDVAVTSGTVYYIRVYEYNAAGNTIPPLSTTFNICIIGENNITGDDFYVQNEEATTTTVEAGGTIVVSASQCYTGSTLDSSLGPVYLGYYLSTNTSFSSSSDTFIDYDSSGLGSDDPCDDESETLTIPAGTSPGIYYLLFVADYENSYSETDENNNVKYIKITITAGVSTNDIYIENATVDPTTVKAGNNIVVNCEQYYSGNSINDVVNDPYVGYYLSTNNSFSTSDDILLDEDYSGIGSDDLYDGESATLTIPTSTPSCIYYILFVADHTNLVSEDNENNNVSSIQIIIQNPTRIDPNFANDFFKVFPNPTTGKFDISEIEALGNKLKVNIIDSQGKIIYSSVYDNFGNKISLDLSSYPEGLYLIRLSNNEACYHKKVIKK